MKELTNLDEMEMWFAMANKMKLAGLVPVQEEESHTIYNELYSRGVFK